MIRRTRVEIDLAAIVANAHEVRRVVGTAVYAVVKADAYGHGAVEVAKALAGVVDGFCTSLVEEGVALREAGITGPILVMGPSLVGGEDEMVAAELTPVISSHEELVALAYVARGRPSDAGPIEAHLKVDTGMGRLGLASERAPELAVEARRNGIAIVGLMTHFACADTDDPVDPHSMTRTQLARFAEVERAVLAAGAPLQVRHAANSAAALLFPESRLDFVRTGIAIYGNGHWADRGHMAMRLVTAIAQLRRIAKGESVGYGATWTAARESRLAILPCGYADGLPRSAGGRAEVAIRGRRVPLVGRISMDIAVADVTDVPDAQVADAAVLLGKATGGVSISAAEFGAWTGLSEYEVTCGLSKRVPRLYPAPVERRA
ncbi:MAG: alanine racemase [Kofleriaceae bacterium]